MEEPMSLTRRTINLEKIRELLKPVSVSSGSWGALNKHQYGSYLEGAFVEESLRLALSNFREAKMNRKDRASLGSAFSGLDSEFKSDNLEKIRNCYRETKVEGSFIGDKMFYPVQKAASAAIRAVESLKFSGKGKLDNIGEVELGVEVGIDKEIREEYSGSINKNLEKSDTHIFLAQVVAQDLFVPGIDLLSMVSGKPFVASLKGKPALNYKKNTLEFLDVFEKVRDGLLEDVAKIAESIDIRNIFSQEKDGLMEMASTKDLFGMIEYFVDKKRKNPEDAHIDVCLGALTLAECYDISFKKMKELVDDPFLGFKEEPQEKLVLPDVSGEDEEEDTHSFSP